MNISKKLLIAALAFSTLANTQLDGMKRAYDCYEWALERVCKRQRTEPGVPQEQQLAPQSDLRANLPAEINAYILAILVNLNAFDFTTANGVVTFMDYVRLIFRLSLSDSVSIVRAILTAANVDLSKPLNNGHRITALNSVCMNNKIDICRVICCLVTGDKFLNMVASTDGVRLTAVSTAILYSYPSKMLKTLLIAAGDDVPVLLDMRNEDGTTPLMCSWYPLTDMLLEFVGKNLYEQLIKVDLKGKTVLHHYKGFELLAKLPDVAPMLIFMQDVDGQTPLHIQAEKGNSWSVEKLLNAAGRNARTLVLMPNAAGKTPWDLANERMLTIEPDWRKKDAQKTIDLLEEALEPDVYPCTIQ